MKKLAGIGLILLSFSFVYMAVQVYANQEAMRVIDDYGWMAVVAKIGSVILFTYLAFMALMKGIAMLREE
ncbi:hypothetical protein GCM10028803_18220 [Larkinella knui]|uniref:Uncharacterized protein n=1 Tax=Larkinella knui TaxID=2025310 RepID=A0A3P1CUL6_9BACT|nr:hypothetical protein [Larkinella knui]RRB16929.1 hypothetical protein EHT87_01170 [Larkinella knui]